LTAVTDARLEIEPAHLPESGDRQVCRAQFRGKLGQLDAAGENEPPVEVAGDPQGIEPGSGNQHRQQVARRAESAFRRQPVAGRSQFDVRFAQALAGQVDLAAASQRLLAQTAIAKLEAHSQREPRPAAALRLELRVETRGRQPGKTARVEIPERPAQRESARVEQRDLATGGELRVAGHQPQGLDGYRGRIDQQLALDRELRTAQVGLQALAMQAERGAQRAGQLRAAQAAIKGARIERGHRDAQRQLVIAQTTAALQTATTGEADVEIGQAQFTLAERQPGGQRFDRQKLPVDGARATVDHRQAPPQFAGLALRPQLAAQVELRPRRSLDPGGRVDPREFRQHLGDRLDRQGADPRLKLAGNGLAGAGGRRDRAELADERELVEATVGREIEGERPLGDVALDPGPGRQGKGRIGCQRRLRADRQAGDAGPQLGQAMPRAVTRRPAAERLGDAYRLALRLLVIGDFDAPEEHLFDLDRQGQPQAVRHRHRLAAGDVGDAQIGGGEAADGQAPAQQIDRAPVHLQVAAPGCPGFRCASAPTAAKTIR
jgi:hypothetical protein